MQARCRHALSRLGGFALLAADALSSVRTWDVQVRVALAEAVWTRCDQRLEIEP
jgi:hypothetical protein